MPTIKDILQEYTETTSLDHDKCQQLITGNHVFSLVQQEEMTDLLNRKLTKNRPTNLLNQQLKEAIASSVIKIKKQKDKSFSKECYTHLVDFINQKYSFSIDLYNVKHLFIATPEERVVYLLRETERRKKLGKTSSLTDISQELGCSRRALEKDIKKITEDGFKLLGLNIQLLEEEERVLDMRSTPHPIVLIQNITQILVLLEGLRSMENIQAYRSYARETALSIWNQLTEYAQNKVLDAIENFHEKSEIMIQWYLDLGDEKTYNQRFISERRNSQGDIRSQLLYYGKSGEGFNLIYKNKKNQEQIIHQCIINRLDIEGETICVRSPQGEIEVEIDTIIDLEPQ